MKTYSFVEYTCLYFKQVSIREWFAVFEFMLMVFVILQLMTWTAKGLLILVAVLILYGIAKMLWSRLVAVSNHLFGGFGLLAIAIG